MLRPVPPGLRRRAPHRPTGSRRRLPAVRHRPHLEHRVAARAAAPVLGFDPARSHVLERRRSSGLCGRSFRPELVNRLDRIVVFRPFERSAMRALLDKELTRRPRTPRPPQPAVGRRGRRVGVHVPHRERLQPRARRATAQARARAASAGAARRSHRRAVRTRRRPVPLRHALQEATASRLRSSIRMPELELDEGDGERPRST